MHSPTTTTTFTHLVVRSKSINSSHEVVRQHSVENLSLQELIVPPVAHHNLIRSVDLEADLVPVSWNPHSSGACGTTLKNTGNRHTKGSRVYNSISMTKNVAKFMLEEMQGFLALFVHHKTTLLRDVRMNAFWASFSSFLCFLSFLTLFPHSHPWLGASTDPFLPPSPPFIPPLSLTSFLPAFARSSPPSVRPYSPLFGWFQQTAGRR